PHFVILGHTRTNTLLHAVNAIFQLAVYHLTAYYSVMATDITFNWNIQFCIKSVLTAGHITFWSRQERFFHNLLALSFAHAGIRTLATENLCMQLTLCHSKRQRTPVVLGIKIGEGHQTATKAPVAGVGNGPLVTGKTLII